MIVVSLKPVKAVTGVRLRNTPESLPLVSWKVCNLRSGDTESYQPVSQWCPTSECLLRSDSNFLFPLQILAAARGSIVYFSQVSATDDVREVSDGLVPSPLLLSH